MSHTYIHIISIHTFNITSFSWAKRVTDPNTSLNNFKYKFDLSISPVQIIIRITIVDTYICTTYTNYSSHRVILYVWLIINMIYSGASVLEQHSAISSVIVHTTHLCIIIINIISHLLPMSSILSRRKLIRMLANVALVDGCTRNELGMIW